MTLTAILMLGAGLAPAPAASIAPLSMSVALVGEVRSSCRLIIDSGKATRARCSAPLVRRAAVAGDGRHILTIRPAF